jgi:hypothetical protein
VRPERFELPTYCSGGNRSIHLSYGRSPIGSVYTGGLRSINASTARCEQFTLEENLWQDAQTEAAGADRARLNPGVCWAFYGQTFECGSAEYVPAVARALARAAKV